MAKVHNTHLKCWLPFKENGISNCIHIHKSVFNIFIDCPSKWLASFNGKLHFGIIQMSTSETQMHIALFILWFATHSLLFISQEALVQLKAKSNLKIKV